MRYRRKRQDVNDSSASEDRIPRPGIGFVAASNKRGDGKHSETSLCYGIGVIPIQPLYEAIEMTPAEILQVIKNINPKATLTRQMQVSGDVCYEIQWPDNFTE